MFRICCLTAMLALGAVTHPPGPRPTGRRRKRAGELSGAVFDTSGRYDPDASAHPHRLSEEERERMSSTASCPSAVTAANCPIRDREGHSQETCRWCGP